MAYETLPDSILTVGKPTKRDIFTRIKNNEDDLNSRLGAVEGSTAKIIVFDQIVKKPTEHKIGDIKLSYLTEAEFQKQFDNTWILADGRSIIGSGFQSLTGLANAPDMRGRVPRVKDHSAGVNPDELALGAVQADLFGSHKHTDNGHGHGITESNHSHGLSNDSHSHPVTDVSHGHTHNNITHNHVLNDPLHNHADIGHPNGISDPGHSHQIMPAFDNFDEPWDLVVTGKGPVTGRSVYTASSYTGISVNAGHSGVTMEPAAPGITIDGSFTGLTTTQANTTGATIDGAKTNLTVNTGNADLANTGGVETRMKNITVNAFIKINESLFTTSLLWKSPFAFTILGAVINNLIAGDSGDLEIDVFKGTDLSSLSSIFSTKPKLNFTAGNYANSTNAVIATPAVSAGEWLRLDVRFFQHGQNSFHAYITGEV